METDVPKKRYVVKHWDVRLKSGAVAEFNIREDLGDRLEIKGCDGEPWWIWTWAKPARVSNIRHSEIAAWDYEEIEREEMSLYKPKKAAHATTEEKQIVIATLLEGPAYVPKIARDDQA